MTEPVLGSNSCPTWMARVAKSYSSGTGFISGVVDGRSVGEEGEQVVAGDHGDRLAVLGHEQRIRFSERGAGCVHGFVHTDQTERGPDKFPDRVGHLGVAAEDLLEQRP